MVTHGHTIFPKAICVLVFPILQSKKHEAKNLQPKIVLRKECREKIFTNTFDSGTFEETILKKILQKVEQWWAWEIELIACYITVRIPPNSLISPGCCILRVCAPAAVYKRVGGPAFLTICIILFEFLLSTKNIYVIGVGNNACILVRNLSVTKGWPSATLISGQNFGKSLWFFRNFKQVLLCLCILVLRRGYLDANIKEVCNIISIYFCTHKNAGQQRYTINKFWKSTRRKKSFCHKVILKAVRILTRWLRFAKKQVTMISIS